MIPPNEIKNQRRVLWQLTKLPYGISQAGRQWAKTIESWVLASKGGNFERVYGIGQLYVLRGHSGRLLLIVAEVTEDILVGVQTNTIAKIISRFKDRFELGKVTIDDRFNFN